MTAPSFNYHCHICNKGVHATECVESGEFKCEECGQTFVEKLSANPTTEDAQDLRQWTEAASQETSGTSQERVSVQAQTPEPGQIMGILSQTLLGPRAPRTQTTTRDGEDSNQDDTLNSAGLPPQSLLDTIRMLVPEGGRVGTNVIHYSLGGAGGESNSGPDGIRGNIGDYVFGNLSNVINQLMENSGSASTPANTDVVARLPRVKATEEMVEAGYECTICQEQYELGEETIKLPCDHYFHPSCVSPWFETHDSCPVCRLALPSESSGASSGNTDESTRSD